MDNSKIIEFYKQFSQFTYPGLYLELLKSLPDNISELGLLVRKSIVHRSTLVAGNTGTNSDMCFGDISQIPWFRQAKDDNFSTASAIFAELIRRDGRFLVLDREPKDKLILTCRYVAIVMASILKAKGIPTRVRSGFAQYFNSNGDDTCWDHWIIEYWNVKEHKWIACDVDGSFSMDDKKIDPYYLKENDFYYSTNAWIDIREGRVTERQFWNAMPYSGLNVVAWKLFYDFHCLMNNEIIYLHHPSIVSLENFCILDRKILNDIDELANLMIDPDKNFEKLQDIWNTNKEFRLLKGALL